MIFSYNEFHVSREIREKCDFPLPLFASYGNVILGSLKNVRLFAAKLNALIEKDDPNKQVSAGSLNAMGLLDEIFHFASMKYRETKYLSAGSELIEELERSFTKEKLDELLLQFTNEFPPVEVYQGKISAEEYLKQTAVDAGTGLERTNREATFEEMIMLHLANENPAFKPFLIMFNDKKLSENPLYEETWKLTKAFYKKLPYWGTYGHDLINFLKEPVNFAPDSLRDQLEYVRTHWADLLGDWITRLLSGIDVINEEFKPAWHGGNGGSPDMAPPSYEYLQNEYERFSDDSEWMPRVVLMAKTVLVWLDQLSKKYQRTITRLDQIPDEELDALRDEGFTGLWLIGLWQRSEASSAIKKMCGNPEAAASAYSLKNYEIADNLGGWPALENLRTRLWHRGIRLASDMVPNHTGMDSDWISNRPELFVQRRDNPFPQYTFNGVNLSHDNRVSIFLEDHYYSKNDCAVVFKRVDNYTGDTRYIYHGNDGTGLPWNDTAQIDFLNPVAREAVMQEILHVARNFPIIRFDAAMVLAKKHIKRLWYPEPGRGGDIATRSEYALTPDQFEAAIPNEFWREVVDRVAKEVPDTLLLAEAFWMMEGYFTRTLGMHRVYNSAFMNMLKKEENQKYRDTVKNTIQFDPQVLKRFVNFMNNPDEETAVAQFGRGDKYFGVCTLMSTMPGLPMFGHGQLEGFEEKYGMEYVKAYYDEKVDQGLMDRHWKEIFPLLKKRYLFAEIENFLFYDVWTNDGWVNENVFAYSNRFGDERAVVFYNNKYDRADGWIKVSCEFAKKTGNKIPSTQPGALPGATEDEKVMVTKTLSEGLGIGDTENDFVIFREQRSGMWFMRTNKEIVEKGLYVCLNGFESQVLMDFRFESDGADCNGKWRQLYNFLGGKGTPDIEIAWQELHYKDLYASFRKIFTDELSEKLDIMSMSEKERKTENVKYPKTAEIMALVEDNAKAFYELAEKTALEENPKLKKVKFNSLKTFKSAVTTLLKAYKDVKLEKIPVASKAKTASEFLAFGSMVFADIAEILCAYAIISEISKSGFAEKWSLDRKFAEIFREWGNQSPNLQNIFRRILILSKVTKNLKASKLGTLKEDKIAGNVIVTEIMGGNHAWMMAGCNEYNGIRWFNKELSDQSLYLAHVALIVEESSANQEKILRLYKKIHAAKDAAEYKCADFEKVFEIAKPKAKAKSSGKSVSRKGSVSDLKGAKPSAGGASKAKAGARKSTTEGEKRPKERPAKTEKKSSSDKKKK